MKTWFYITCTSRVTVGAGTIKTPNCFMASSKVLFIFVRNVMMMKFPARSSSISIVLGLICNFIYLPSWFPREPSRKFSSPFQRHRAKISLPVAVPKRRNCRFLHLSKIYLKKAYKCVGKFQINKWQIIGWCSIVNFMYDIAKIDVILPWIDIKIWPLFIALTIFDGEQFWHWIRRWRIRRRRFRRT